MQGAWERCRRQFWERVYVETLTICINTDTSFAAANEAMERWEKKFPKPEIFESSASLEVPIKSEYVPAPYKGL